MDNAHIIKWTAAQQRTLEQKAEGGGRYRDLMVFYAVRGLWDRFHALAPAATEGCVEDSLTYDILGLVHAPERAWAALERLHETHDPWLFYSLAKHFLGRDDTKGALEVVKRQFQRNKDDGAQFETTVLNLVAKYAAQRGETALAMGMVERSLSINPNQKDIAALGEAVRSREPISLDLHLSSVPKAFDVSFYVPVYNGAAYLRGTIEALLGQGHPLREVLIVDDGSQDDSVTIARTYPVRLIAFNENRGLAAARNAGFQSATTEFVGAVDGDVCADPDYTAHVLMEFENASPQLAGIGGRLIETYTDTPADAWRSRHLPQGWYPMRMYFDALPCNGTLAEHRDADLCHLFFINGCNTVFRREAVLRAGGYNERFRTNAEDAGICLALRLNGFHLAFTRDAVTRHHRRDTVQSVIKTAWNYGFWGRHEAGLYRDASTMLRHLAYAMDMGNAKLGADLADGALDCAYLDFLMGFYWPLLDVRYGVDQGLFSMDQGAYIQHELLGRLRRLDRHLGGDLYGKVRRDTIHLLVKPVYDRDALTPETRALLDAFLEVQAAAIDDCPRDLYQLLAR